MFLEKQPPSRFKRTLLKNTIGKGISNPILILEAQGLSVELRLAAFDESNCSAR